MFIILIFITLCVLIVNNGKTESSPVDEYIDLYLHFFLGVFAVSCYSSPICFTLLLFPIGTFVVYSIGYNWKYIWNYFIRDAAYLLTNLFMFSTGMWTRINDI